MKSKFLNSIFIGLVLTATSITANAGLISETINLSGGTSHDELFSSFDDNLGTLNSVLFSYDITLAGTIADDECTVFDDCEGTRTLQVNFNSLTDSDSDFIDNDQFLYELALNVNDTVSFNTSDFTNWTSLTSLSVSSSCSGDCWNVLGAAQLSGTATLSYEYTDVPEPSTFAIFALGIIGLASRRFKKTS